MMGAVIVGQRHRQAEMLQAEVDDLAAS